MTRRVLITGAAGFIGSNLCSGLGAETYDVVACVTSNPTGVPPSAGRTYCFRLPSEELASIVAEEKPDFIVHCAGGSSIARSLRVPHRDFIDNVVATESVMQAVAASSPQTRVILLSSAAVYGNPVELPSRESTPPAPISPYGFHKWMAELVCHKYHQLAQVPVAVLRVFSVFGPGLRKQVVWDIYQKWLDSEVVTLSGSGSETRDWIYIDDLVRVIRLVIEKGEFRAETLNVAPGREITIHYLAALMSDALGGGKSVCFTGESRPGDPSYWKADVSKLKALGFSDWLPIEEGMNKYVTWVRGLKR